MLRTAPMATRVAVRGGCARGAAVGIVCAILLGCGDDASGGGATGAPIPIGGAGGTVAGMGVTTGGTGAGMTAVTGGMGAAGMMAVTGGMGGGPTGAPTFTAIFDEIITKGSVGNCVFGACHGAPADATANGNLHMDARDRALSYAALVGPTSTGAMCAGMTLVVPGQPDQSLLVLKLRATPPCGMRMPIPTPLGDAQLQQIETWVLNGAMND